MDDIEELTLLGSGDPFSSQDIALDISDQDFFTDDHNYGDFNDIFGQGWSNQFLDEPRICDFSGDIGAGATNLNNDIEMSELGPQFSSLDTGFAPFCQGENNHPVSYDSLNQILIESSLHEKTMYWSRAEIELNQEPTLQRQGPFCNLNDLNTVNNIEQANNARIWNQGYSAHAGESKVFRNALPARPVKGQINDSSIPANFTTESQHLDPLLINDVLDSHIVAGTPEANWAGGFVETDMAEDRLNVDHRMLSCTGGVGYIFEEPCSNLSQLQKSSKDRGIRKHNSKDEWERWRPYLYHQYIVQGRTAEQVAFRMSSIYGFSTKPSRYTKKFREWKEFRKNGEKAKNGLMAQTERHPGWIPRRRRAQALPKSRPQVPPSRPLVTMMPARQKKAVPPSSLTPRGTPYHQERLLDAIDDLVKGLFGSKKRGWTPNSIAFVSPAGVADNSKLWEDLSDGCSRIADLIRAERYDHVQSLLVRMFAGLQLATKSCDPNFLVHFWRTCLVLLTTRIRARNPLSQFIFIRVFLQCLRTGFASSLRKHPMVELVDALYCILASTPHELRNVLGVGYSKAVDGLQQMVGPSHHIIFKMESHCAKHWNKYIQLTRQDLEVRCTDLLESQEIRKNPTLKITILHDFTYAMSEGKYISDPVRDKAIELLALTADDCRERTKTNNLRYTSNTRSFALASELLALYHLEPGNSKILRKGYDRNLSVLYMDQAIETLRHGDLECRIRAVALSKRLEVWVKSFGEVGKAKVEKERSREILPKLPSKPVTPLNAYHVASSSSQQAGSKNNRSRRKRRMVRDTLLTSLAQKV